jgi:hypothetical protein
MTVLKDFSVPGENVLPIEKLGQEQKAQRVAWSELTYCHGGVSRVTTGCAGEGIKEQRTKA